MSLFVSLLYQALSKVKQDRVDVQTVTVVEVGNLDTVFQPPQGSRVRAFSSTSTVLLNPDVELSEEQEARWQELIDQSAAAGAVEATLCADVQAFLKAVSIVSVSAVARVPFPNSTRPHALFPSACIVGARDQPDH